MLGIPMLGMVGAKTAIAKKIDKNARKDMQDAAPAVLKALGGMPRRKDEDRPADSIPISRLNRFNYGAPTIRREAPAQFKTAIKEAAKDPENKGAQTLAPTLRFCGGMSKPYKK